MALAGLSSLFSAGSGAISTATGTAGALAQQSANTASSLANIHAGGASAIATLMATDQQSALIDALTANFKLGKKGREAALQLI